MSRNSTAMPTPDAVAGNGYGTTMEEKAGRRRTLGARLAAFDVLRRQVAGRRKSTPRDVGKLASASVVRFLPDARSGRACGD